LPTTSTWTSQIPADSHPAAASLYDQRVVHVQGAFGGSADGSDPDDLGTVDAPTEVVIPAQPARVEQGYHLPGYGVWRFYLCPFEFVARMTAKAQILELGGTAGGSWDDVIQYWRGPGDVSEAVTIGTLAAGFGQHAPAQGQRNAGTGHSFVRKSSRAGIQ
jgi:hypothetical protein